MNYFVADCEVDAFDRLTVSGVLEQVDSVDYDDGNDYADDDGDYDCP